MKKAFCTVCTENVYYNLRVFLHSLVRNGGVKDIPFIIFTTYMRQEIREEIKTIYGDNVEFRIIDFDKYDKVGKYQPQYFSFEAFTLSEYDKVVFFDCDLLCLKNISGIFDTAERIGMAHELRRDCFNAGVIVLGKEMLNQNEYYKLIGCSAPDYIFGRDQKVYNYLYGGIIEMIPRKLNTLVSEIDDVDCNILHYIHKPLSGNSKERMSALQYDTWISYLEDLNKNVSDKYNRL